MKKQIIALALAAAGFGAFSTNAAAFCCVCEVGVQQTKMTEQALTKEIQSAEGSLSNQIDSFQESVEDLLKKIAKTLQGEIAKQTQAMRVVQESIASYEIQESLRREAAQTAEKFEQPKFTCQTMAMSEGVHVATNSARKRANEYTQTRVSSMLNEANPTKRVAASYERSTKKYCSEFDIKTKRCRGEPDLVAGDVNAAFIFGSATTNSLTHDEKQSEAVDAYIERIVGAPPPALPFRCETDQCKAYEEMRKDYAAAMSLPMHSMAEVSSSYAPQTGLATKAGVKDVVQKDDISLMEAIDAYIRMKFSKDSLTSNGSSPSTQMILRDLAQNQSFRLWMDFQMLRQLERIEVMQAAELSIIGGAHMRAALAEQRKAAIASAGK